MRPKILPTNSYEIFYSQNFCLKLMSTLFKIGGYRSKPTHTSNVYTRPLKIDTNKEMPKDKYANANPISGKKRQLCESNPNLRKKEATIPMPT